MDLLGGHIALRQEKYLLPVCLIGRHVYNDDGVPRVTSGEAALDKDIAWLDLLRVRYFFELLLQGIGAGVLKDGFQIGAKRRIRRIGGRGLFPAHFIAIDDRTVTIKPFQKWSLITVGEIKTDLPKMTFRIQVLSPQANNGISTLLKILGSGIDIEDRIMSSLICLQTAVIKMNGRMSFL